MNKKICAVYITAANKKEAEKLAKSLVKERLAACANILPNIESFYWWENAVQHDQEAVLIVKTKATLLTELEKTVKELHSYSCPCVVAIPIIHASREYQEWVIKETK